MPKIYLQPTNEVIELKTEESVREALQRKGIELETPCDGKGICGKCTVWVENPEDVPPTPHENISPRDEAKGLRLACQLVPKKDLTIRLPEDLLVQAKDRKADQSILEGERITVSRTNPAIKLNRQEGGWSFHYDQENSPYPLQIWEQSYSPKGLAIDLGTTTIVAVLVALDSGKELATSSSLNPQIKFGHDVMSRIHHGSESKGLEELSDTVQNGLNVLIQELCSDSGSNPREILDVSIGGNTTMLQLAAGIDPEPLGKVPFKVGIKGGVSYPAKQFGLSVNPAARVYIPPLMHAFIGSDISSGLLVSNGFFNNQSSLLYIDIGTNGETGVNIRGKRHMTSTAAGPAFEGTTISSGMRASVGAINHVSTDGSSIFLHTIGNAGVKGICGSGIIDLIACLLQTGVIDASGRMRKPSEKEGLSELVAYRLEEVNGQAAIKLSDGVYFTQNDVRQVQLAKAAIITAMDMLLQEAGASGAELEKLVIAGGFGYSLRSDSLEAIGIIPEGTGKKVNFAGNASRIGNVLLLTDTAYRRFLEARMQGIEYLSIAENPSFMEHYIESMNFPDPGMSN